MEEVIESITPEKFQKILEKQGKRIDLDQAKIILEFMKKLAKITVISYLRECSK